MSNEFEGSMILIGIIVLTFLVVFVTSLNIALMLTGITDMVIAFVIISSLIVLGLGLIITKNME